MNATPSSGIPAVGTLADVEFRRNDLTLSLSIPSAQFVALTGPNGSGKTSALRCLAGLESGAAVDWHSARPLRLGYLPQRIVLYPAMSLSDNIASSLRFAGADSSKIDQRTSELLDLLGIRALAGRRPHEVSGGQRQRAGLARAIAAAPELVLLDEPFTAIDVESRTEVRRTVFEQVIASGARCVMATHDDDDIAEAGAVVVSCGEPRSI